MWDIIDNFYFLFEPRIDFGFSTIILTLFYHPWYYLEHRYDSERGSIDVNFDWQFGHIQKQGIQGGVESTVSFKASSGDTPLTIKASPYLSVVADGVMWDFKVIVNAYPFSVANLFSAYVGVKTGF